MLRWLITGVKVLVKGMGWVNWAPTAPMKVTVMLLLDSRGALGAGKGEASVLLAARRRVARRVLVVVYIVVFLGVEGGIEG